MRQRLTIILTFVVIIGALVVLNTVTYVKDEKLRDTEILPNRSSYHSGPTGTRALHDFLSESGYKVMRWREAPERLLSDAGRSISTFVVIGTTQLPFSDDQAGVLREWISRGGCFVLIDRDFAFYDPAGISRWAFSSRTFDFPNFEVNPGDAAQMTENVNALSPIQPTRLTHNVGSVMPSRYAARFTITPVEPKPSPEKGAGVGTVSTEPEDEDFPPFAESDEPPPPMAIVEEEPSATAPVVHLADKNGAVLLDYAYGNGRVILLSDPYIVTNAGIRANDNLQLAINVLTAHEGLIAFDEYHQGRGVTRNAFASYFSGTPVLAIGAQIVLLILLILWSNARRFGRPLPLPRVDRRSSLEFVASMAELQERSRAYDLAIENIYSRTRRVLARYAGMNYNSSRTEIAQRVASRSSIDAHQLETLMRQCEEAINGEPINWRQAVDLVKRLRELERKLGLRMRSRDARQAAENI
ncbi:MAG TPA: DUF4350 domain-containing protein [Pyrinomonadaceae bacterium]|nr:DUF4350 domain-containing protein [Pyrinomonadaceae bacterium]